MFINRVLMHEEIYIAVLFGVCYGGSFVLCRWGKFGVVGLIPNSQYQLQEHQPQVEGNTNNYQTNGINLYNI